MPRQYQTLVKLAERPKLLYVLVFLGFLVLHMLVFSNIIAAIPNILAGHTVIAREELVPIFDFKTQYFSEGTSDLTSSDEVRVAYSFWTAWVRAYNILPFALVLVNTVSAFILFYAFLRIGRYFSERRLLSTVLAAALAAGLIHFILLYAKVAHFYALIIGFSMFALSLSFVLEQLFFKQRIRRKDIIIVSLLVLFNPAIHYHVLFYLVFLAFLLVHTIFVFTLSRGAFWATLKRSGVYFLLITALSLIPYMVFIILATGSSLESVSTQIPVNYWMISYSSVALPFIFTFDIAGHSDLLRYGDYMPNVPRYASLVITFLIASVFLFKKRGQLDKRKEAFLIGTSGVLLFSMWMSIGYSMPTVFSFHSLLSKVVLYLSDQTNPVAVLFIKLTSVFINILRFPHRFQFIYFYLAGLLITIALLQLKVILDKKYKNYWISVLLISLVVAFPILINSDYRSAATSGSFGTLLQPYDIPKDLVNIKKVLNTSTDKNKKLFILPTLESNREIVKNKIRYSFIDKFLIYYLNQPTYYYGVGANTQNKLPAYLAYQAINTEQDWWNQILINNLGITYIIQPKHIVDRPVGVIYMPGIEEKIVNQLNKSDRFHKVYDGNDYALYASKKPREMDKNLLVDMRWANFLEYFNSAQPTNEALYFPIQLDNFIKKTGSKRLLTDSPERSYYDLSTKQKGSASFYPNSALLPFTSELVASSNFTNNALTLSALYSKTSSYNYLEENVPNLVNLKTPQFIGLTKDSTAKISIPFSVPSDGKYRILVHGASRSDALTANVDGRETSLQKITSDLYQQEDYVDLTYFYVDITLSQGGHTMSLQNHSKNPLLVESLTPVAADSVPTDFDQIDTARLKIRPSDQQNLFEVEIEQSDGSRR